MQYENNLRTEMVGGGGTKKPSINAEGLWFGYFQAQKGMKC